MFSIIISEKGGAERREAYDRTEINIGRVQGNDLMLPKGNVSKRHARLLYRDGRFIVTDLKSTNGTYVNGRKISQATIVREGDKIYIGDFVLRIEAASQAGASSPSPEGAPPEARDQNEVSQPSHSSQPSSAEKNLGRASLPRIEAKNDGRGADVISHFPLEHDPDESVPAYAVPGPPRIPTGARPSPTSPSRPAGPTPAAIATSPGPPPLPGAVAGRATSPSAIAPAHGTAMASPLPTSSPSGSPASPGPLRRAPLSERVSQPQSQSQDSGQLGARRAAVAALVDRVTEMLDLSALSTGQPADDVLTARIERALGERVTSMKADGEIAPEVDPDAVVVEARREILELGPIGPLLEDEDVSEIQIFRHDFVVAMHGRRQVPTDVAFSSEHALVRVIRRLCLSGGSALAEEEQYVERRLPQGARLFALMPPTPEHGHMVLLRKPQRADMTLDDLVRSGTISRAIAGLLSQCVTARANVLVTGSLGSGTTSLLGALAAAGSTDDRVVVLQEDDEIVFNQPHTISILLGDSVQEGERAVRSAARAHPDRVVVGAFAGAVAAEVVDAIGDGVDGVLAAARAPTLRQAVLRLTADLAATRPGLTPEVAREWLASSFDIAIEIARLRDGRHRVLRVAELDVEQGQIVIRDIFTFAFERTAAGGAVEGTFQPSGVVPKIVDDLASRGVTVDQSVFKRTR